MSTLEDRLAALISAIGADWKLLAPKASPVFTGNPTGPTPSPGDNDTSLATTAFVTAAVAAGGGGGGGTNPLSYFATTGASGDINMGTCATFTDIPGLTLAVPAAVGDKLLIKTFVTPYTTSGGDIDIAINVAGIAKSINGYANNGTTRPSPIPVEWIHTVASGDISGGNVAIKAQLKSSTGGNWVYNNATHGNFATLSAVNLGSGVVGTPTNFHGARAKRSAAMNMTAASVVTLPMDAEDFDTDNFHDNSTNPSRITIPAGLGGYYAVSAGIALSNANPGRLLVFVMKNNSGAAISGLHQDITYGGGEFAAESIAGVIQLAAGDYIELTYYCQCASGTAPLQSASLSAYRVG